MMQRFLTVIRQNIQLLETFQKEFPLPARERARVRGCCDDRSPSPHSSPVKGEDVLNCGIGEKSIHTFLRSRCVSAFC
jgi:hypothetical protein